MAGIVWYPPGCSGLTSVRGLRESRGVYVLDRVGCSTMAYAAILAMYIVLGVGVSEAQGVVNASSAVETLVAEVSGNLEAPSVLPYIGAISMYQYVRRACT